MRGRLPNACQGSRPADAGVSGGKVMRLADSCPKVAIIVPTYNTVADCLSCLESLMKLAYPDFEVTVVDDGSTDGTSEAVSRLYPRVRILRGDGNLWWTGCMNLGSRDAIERGADYVFCMNSDGRVAPDCVEELVRCAEENKPCIVGSLIYYIDDPKRICGAGAVLHWPFPGTVLLGAQELDQGQFEGVREVEHTPGMGTLYPREILLELGYFDPKLPQYHCDSDLALRARKRGYRVLVTSGSRVFNNAGTQGFRLRSGGITWSEIRAVFLSLRSPAHIGTYPRFVWRYSPWFLFPLCLGWCYFRLTLQICRRLWRNIFGYRRPNVLSGSCR
jgi:GT2 family glycosyltransferase